MARRPSKITAIPIARYEAQDAANTIARAREHLANPKMVKAIKAHVDGLNSALTGGLRPKPVRGRAARNSRAPMGGL